jgi:hypothetical protein
MPAMLQRYVDRGASGFAKLTLRSGERILISLAASGLRIHRLMLFGLIPGRTLAVLDAGAVERVSTALGREAASLPDLPEKAGFAAFLASAEAAIADPAAYRLSPAAAGDTLPPTRLALLTRAALAATDGEAFARRITRAAAMPRP